MNCEWIIAVKEIAVKNRLRDVRDVQVAQEGMFKL